MNDQAEYSQTQAEVQLRRNELWLSPREWIVASLLIGLVLAAVPAYWQSRESFEVADDYRIPFDLSNDYWIYQSHIQRTVDDGGIPVVGDSVIWGEYVGHGQTLSAALNALDSSQRYTNCGVSGMHPLALEGLMCDFAPSLKRIHVILHCNLLWLSSPERDLSLVADREIEFNHRRLVPQFETIPAYKADRSERIGHWVNRNLPFRKLALHLRSSAYDNLDLQTWTLEHPYESPFAALVFTTTACERPGKPPMAIQPDDVPWVPLEDSLQWKSFQRIVRRLKDRGNRLFVVMGPYNQSHLTAASRDRFTAIRQEALGWLQSHGVLHCAPAPLPASEYGDASHPLAEGYHRIARQIWASPNFQAWKKSSTFVLGQR